MSISFEKSLLADTKVQRKLPSTFRVVAGRVANGEETKEEDRFALAIEIKLAFPDFSHFDIAKALDLPAEEASTIEDGAASKKESEEKAKASSKKIEKEEKKQHNISSGPIAWTDTNDKGFPNLTPDNVEKALVSLGVKLRHNLFSSRFEVTGLEHQGWPQINDMCLNWIFFRLQKNDINLYISSREILDHALKQVAHKHRYHPVKEYLESVTWDGVSRINTWLIDHAGVKDDAYSRAVMALPLMAAVKRVYEPGCIFHEMLILQSAQGWGKSGMMKDLCPNQDWFSDDLPLGVDAKVVMERTAGKWFIEAAEMQNFSKISHNQMKAFMSRSSDRARLAFERNPVDVPRQFVIWGTVNEGEFLSDPTGDRRYWPLAMSHAVEDGVILSIRDQLWAEAYHRVVELKESIRLDKSLWELAEASREQFTVNNPFKEALANILYGISGRITNASLYKICDIPIEQRRGHPKLKKAMEELGWKQSSPVKKDGTSVRCWERGGSVEWLEPDFDSRTKRWSFAVDRKTTNEQFDRYTQGDFEDMDPEDKLN